MFTVYLFKQCVIYAIIIMHCIARLIFFINTLGKGRNDFVSRNFQDDKSNIFIIFILTIQIYTGIYNMFKKERGASCEKRILFFLSRARFGFLRELSDF